MFPIQFKGETYYYKKLHKVCTKCKENRRYDEYNVAFVKSTSNYNPVLKPVCKTCSKKIIRDYRNRTFVLDGEEMSYAKKHYRSNREKSRNINRINSSRYRNELSDIYVAKKVSESFSISKQEAYNNPELMELKRASILTSRIIKKIKQHERNT